MKRVTFPRVLRWTSLAIAVATLAILPPPARATDVPMQAIFAGTFVINLATGQLSLGGDGVARHMGNTTILGQSVAVPLPENPVCFSITNDLVVWTAANGDQLFNVNAGQDCLDFTQGPLPVIVGTGTYTFAGGTGRFAGATGNGIWNVRAPVTTLDFPIASGTFELLFSGTISSVGSE